MTLSYHGDPGYPTGAQFAANCPWEDQPEYDDPPANLFRCVRCFEWCDIEDLGYTYPWPGGGWKQVCTCCCDPEELACNQ